MPPEPGSGDRFRGGFDYKGLVGCYHQLDGSRRIVMYDYVPEPDGSHVTGEVVIPAEDETYLGVIYDRLGRHPAPFFVAARAGGKPGRPRLFADYF